MLEVGIQYVISAREYEVICDFLARRAPESIWKRSLALNPHSRSHDHNASAFRSALRVYLATAGGLKSWDLLVGRLLQGRSSKTAPPRKPLVASSSKLALSMASLVFFHRIFFRFFWRLRLQLLQEKAKRIRERYPKLVSALTARIAPAVGASLSGLALGICPADQLRLTISIYTASRSLEFLYNALNAGGYVRKKPWWFGSWLLFPIAQGQLLHAFVFDRDCFPQAYGDFILKYTPDYIQRRPFNISPKVAWPTSNHVVDSIAELARLKWPPFVSPILHPADNNTLPASINPMISSITSRAHPAIHNLSCALIHPSDPSCFAAYLQQNLTAFPQLTRFFALYYGAFSLLRIKQMWKSPIAFFNRLAGQILKTSAAISGAIGASWGSICLFATILPRSVFPQFRFFLGGLLGGMFQFLDRGSAGHNNTMYACRASVDSLWKVGVKRRWWKGIKGGDVLIFAVAMAICGSVYELQVEGMDGAPARAIERVLRGEMDIGLQNRNVEKEEDEKTI